MAGTVHMHVSTWFIALILFVSVFLLNKTGKVRAAKMILMILRLFYLLIIATGIKLLTYLAHINSEYVTKIAAGLLVITMFEILLVRFRKGKSTGVFWVLLVPVLVYTIYLGYRLPL